MLLRLLVLIQLMYLAIIATLSRGFDSSAGAREWGEGFVALGSFPALFVLPPAVFIASGRYRLSRGIRWGLVAVEAAMVYATILAILPAVQ